jgi:hypothetical protein
MSLDFLSFVIYMSKPDRGLFGRCRGNARFDRGMLHNDLEMQRSISKNVTQMRIDDYGQIDDQLEMLGLSYRKSRQNNPIGSTTSASLTLSLTRSVCHFLIRPNSSMLLLRGLVKKGMLARTRRSHQ